MLDSYTIGAGATAALIAGWIAVQIGWSRAFAGERESGAEADALAVRRGDGRATCWGCDCGGAARAGCSRENAKEETR
jgi:hypothetical protein